MFKKFLSTTFSVFLCFYTNFCYAQRGAWDDPDGEYISLDRQINFVLRISVLVFIICFIREMLKPKEKIDDKKLNTKINQVETKSIYLDPDAPALLKSNEYDDFIFPEQDDMEYIEPLEPYSEETKTKRKTEITLSEFLADLEAENRSNLIHNSLPKQSSKKPSNKSISQKTASKVNKAATKRQIEKSITNETSNNLKKTKTVLSSPKIKSTK